MRESTETEQGSTVDKASQVSYSQAVNVSSCRRFRSYDVPLMFSASCCSSSHVEFCKFLYLTLCITAPESCYSLCASAQRSTEVSLDLFPSTPRIQLRRRMQRSRAVNDQGQKGDQWIKCSVNGWRVCCDKIRRRSRRISAATFDHVFYEICLYLLTS